MTYRVALHGSGILADAIGVQILERADLELVTDDADCVLVAPDPRDTQAESTILELLAAGRNVATTADLRTDQDTLLDSCRRGGSTLYRTGFAQFLIQRFVLTATQGMSSIRHIRFVESRSADPVEPPPRTETYRPAIESVARELYAAEAAAVRIVSDFEQLSDRVTLTERAYLDDHHFLTLEAIRYPAAGPGAPAAYTLRIDGDPSDLVMQWEIEPNDDSDVLAVGCAHVLLDAVGAICEAEAGLLIDNPDPHYQHDDRVHR
ncbi:hypothetical protein ACFXHA_31615 [Nocardia sp. NPDC059240]|uniref:hypothetical protein n=1 Tax=Nocardia sp. NPDC059240 TaxID=3346786 RepID=UPI0036CA7D2D